MAKTAKSKTAKSKTATPEERAAAPVEQAGAPGFNAPDLGQVAEAGQRSLAALAALHSRGVRDAMRFNAELMDFARRRITADIQTTDRLARCRSATEAMDALGDFYQGAFRDYAEESTALIRLGTETAEEIAAEASRVGRGKDG
jgi:hypothetical protein